MCVTNSCLDALIDTGGVYTTAGALHRHYSLRTITATMILSDHLSVKRQSAVSAISRPYIRRATSAWRRTCAERLSSLGFEKNTAKKNCTEIMQRCKYPERRT